MRARRPLVAALVAVAAAGHVAFWYLPRERASSLDPRSAAGKLFVAGRQEVRAWIPYPHQNLGAAAQAMEDPAAALAAASRLAGLGEVELPAFGPFAMPPAHALAIAVDPEGDHLEVVLEVFPAVALLARVAGLVAGNALLGGGTVSLSGRVVEVSWRGRAWSVRAQAVPAPAALAEGGDRAVADDSVAGAPGVGADDALALLALSVRHGVVEPGLYRVHRDAGDLVLDSRGQGWVEVAELAESRAREHDLAFVGLRAEGRSGATVLLLPRSGGTGLELPDAAVAWTGDVERWRLPGEKVVRLLGHDLLEARVDAWDVVAIDSASLDAAIRLARDLGERAVAADVTLVIWIRPRDYLPLVSAVAEILDALPIAPAEDVAYWRDLETLLEALGPVERLMVAVGAGGAGARLGWDGG